MFWCVPFFVRTILRTTKGTYCTLGGVGKLLSPAHPLLGCATPPDQSPTEALLGASGKRLSGLLKECFPYTGRQLRPEGDELLEISIDWTVFCVNCAGFCASFLVNCVFPEVFDKGSNPSPTALAVGAPDLGDLKSRQAWDD